MTIFQKRTRSNGYRTFCSFKESEEIGYQCIRQLSMQETRQDLFVISITQSKLVQIIIFHKLVKKICTKNNRLRYLHRCTFILIKFRMTFYNVIQKSQTTPFASQRTVTDTGKMSILIKLHSIKDSNDTYVLHVPILNDGIKNNLTVSIYILKLMPSDMF